MDEHIIPDSAPKQIAFCPICGSSLLTKNVADKPRRVCPNCGYIHFTDPKVGVGVVLLENDHILLVKRAMMPKAGKWSIPAGYLDFGEDPVTTAVREVFEETGLEVCVTGIIDIYHNPEAIEEGGASIFILYRAELVDGKMRAGDDAVDVGFFSSDKLPELAFASTYDVVARWISGEI